GRHAEIGSLFPVATQRRDSERGTQKDDNGMQRLTLTALLIERLWLLLDLCT
ncbi:MAG: hypothetical protein ACI8W3_001363, partial [Myxococcota bacterium]